MNSNTTISKLFAVSLLLVVVLIFLTFFVAPLYGKYENSKEEIASIQHRIAQYKKISQKSDDLNKKLDEILVFNEDQDFYFNADKPALVSAQIQGIIKVLLNNQGAKILSTQPVTSAITDDRQVKISVHCRADIVSLRKLLYEIETYLPVLIIDKINIGRGFRTTFRNQLSNGANEALDVRFDVSGFMEEGVEENK